MTDWSNQSQLLSNTAFWTEKVYESVIDEARPYGYELMKHDQKAHYDTNVSMVYGHSIFVICTGNGLGIKLEVSL
jgi:hypothetical protein